MATWAAGLAWTQIQSTLTGAPGSTGPVTCAVPSRSLMAINTATGRTAATVTVGELPGSIAVTPDGSQVWVGSILDGDITVINPATNTVIGTISGASGVRAAAGEHRHAGWRATRNSVRQGVTPAATV